MPSEKTLTNFCGTGRGCGRGKGGRLGFLTKGETGLSRPMNVIKRKALYLYVVRSRDTGTREQLERNGGGGGGRKKKKRKKKVKKQSNENRVVTLMAKGK